ncbi:MAG: aminopeptidase N [Proteobacteria bacterium]|nr:aminopeptidase N [Pseudomonadota bacterium]
MADEAAKTHAKGASPPVKRRLDYRAPAFLVDAIDLEFQLDPDATTVRSRLRVRRNPAAEVADRDAPLVLDCEAQDAIEVALDGRALGAGRCEIGSGTITIGGISGGATVEVRSRNAPASNTALEGLYLSSGVFCTQCEPEGFRRITAFPDRPDVLARYRVTIIAARDRCPVLLSNGNRVAAGELPGGRHYATWEDPFPKPSYLFALVAGDLAALEDRFVTCSGREVALQIHSTAANLPRCRHAMRSLKRAMRWDEERFGREYDLDTFMIFCADDFNMGAMENKGLNIFNSRMLLADSATATDADFEAIESVVGHEYFHNWTGNRVTCRDWFQLSLKEGLTVFRDQEFSGDVASRAVARIGAVEYLRRDQFAEDAGPMAHPVRPDAYREINNFYTATVYEKGAEVIRMQHTLLGAERFRRGMDLYFDRHDGQAVTCDDFVAAMEDASGVDLGQFRRWYAEAGTPQIIVRETWDEGSRRYCLDLEQRLPPHDDGAPRPALHMPFAVGLVGPDGRDLPLRLASEPQAGPTTRVFELRAAREVFEFADVGVKPVPSLFRNLSAPVRVEFAYADEDLALLAASDTDAVNRWDATQRLLASAILAFARATRAGADAGAGSARAAAVAASAPLSRTVEALLADESSDPSLVALALTPPDPAWVAAQETAIDVDGVSAGWVFVRRELARLHRDAFEAAWERSHPREPWAPLPDQAGRRRLANVALGWLAALDDDRARRRVRMQFDAATNMTDELGALAALRDSASAAAEELLMRFEARWRSEPLVLDKWFALQACSSAPGAVERVQGLIAHPHYNARNPNRVRALVGTFVRANFPGFHRADGAGYDFAATQVRALDRSNPQLAASVAGAFRLWRRFDAHRQSLMHQALVRIARSHELSPDTSEIVARTLGDAPGYQ